MVKALPMHQQKQEQHLLLNPIDDAIAKVSAFRSSFGAVENRIDASINNLTTLKVNTEAAQVKNRRC